MNLGIMTKDDVYFDMLNPIEGEPDRIRQSEASVGEALERLHEPHELHAAQSNKVKSEPRFRNSFSLVLLQVLYLNSSHSLREQALQHSSCIQFTYQQVYE